MKKFIAILLVVTLTMIIPFSVTSAHADEAKSNTSNDLLEIAQTFGVEVDELLYLEENLDAAIAEANIETAKERSIYNGTVEIEIPISPNLTLEVRSGAELVSKPSIKSLLARDPLVTIHVWTEYQVKSWMGITYATATHNGWYDCEEGVSSTPVDSYGDYTTYFPYVSVSTDSNMGPSQYNAWTRTLFNIEVTESGNTAVDYTVTGRIYCDADMNWSTTWE